MTDLYSRIPAALRAVAPRMSSESVTTWLTALMPSLTPSGLTTPHRVAAFLGQVAVESAGFEALQENLNYSVQAIHSAWPERFPTLAAAQPFARKPEALANHVYANRMGNGDEASGDGWRYRGVGLLQITGRANYEAFAKTIGRDDVEAWVLTPPGAAASACWYWSTRGGLNEMADAWAITEITRKINGWTEGLAQRIALSNAALKVLGGASAPGMPQPHPIENSQQSSSTQAQNPGFGTSSTDDSADALNAAQLAKDAQ